MRSKRLVQKQATMAHSCLAVSWRRKVRAASLPGAVSRIAMPVPRREHPC